MYIDYKELGKRIAARRRELGLKQAEVNEAAGLSDKYLSNIERATSVLSVEVLMKLCTALDTTPDRLLLGVAQEDGPRDLKKVIMAKAENMTMQQLRLTISLMDWIISQGLS